MSLQLPGESFSGEFYIYDGFNHGIFNFYGIERMENGFFSGVAQG